MSAAVAAVRPRRTQADRSASTRARLLDATIECLQELGYGRTSTPEIARRAGLSRGAQLHHFPTRTELVTSAVEHLFLRRHQEFLQAFARIDADADRAVAAIEILWSMVSGPTFLAWLELAVAARTDPELREPFRATTDRLIDTVERTFRELFPAPATPNPFYDIAPRFAFSLLEGLALERMHNPDDIRLRQVLDGLKSLAQLVMPAQSS